MMTTHMHMHNVQTIVPGYRPHLFPDGDACFTFSIVSVENGFSLEHSITVHGVSIDWAERFHRLLQELNNPTSAGDVVGNVVKLRTNQPLEDGITTAP